MEQSFCKVNTMRTELPLSSSVCHQLGLFCFAEEETLAKLASLDGRPTSLRPWFLAALQACNAASSHLYLESYTWSLTS